MRRRRFERNEHIAQIHPQQAKEGIESEAVASLVFTQ